MEICINFVSLQTFKNDPIIVAKSVFTDAGERLLNRHSNVVFLAFVLGLV